MTATTVKARSFLKERTIKFCILMAFICIWLLVQVIYFARGQLFMSTLQSSLFQFLISTNLITLVLFLVAAALQTLSMKRKVSYRGTSIKTEIILLCFITCFQTVAAIAFSAGTPSFPCHKVGACNESIFFAIVAWIAPLLFTIHTVELVIRARRLATVDSSVWSFSAWNIDWEGSLSAFNDINAVEKGVAPKTLFLPQSHARKASEAINEKNVLRSLRAKSMPPPPPPKTPSALEQCIIIFPSKVKYTVPRLGPPPKYFIQIPENIQFTVPRLAAAPCPKQRRKERRRQRKLQAAANSQGKKWSRYFSMCA